MGTTGPAFLEDGELSLILFGGKGGVGKTTCSAATSLHLARRFPDRRILLVSTDPAHSLADSLAGSSLPANLEFREIDFRQSLERFKEAHAQHFREIALRGTFLDEQDISSFLDLSAPGFDELMAFLEIAALLQNQACSCLVVDTAPTGHTLRLLELPRMMRTWLAAFDAMLAKHRFLAQLYGHGSRDAADAFLDELRASMERLAGLLTDPLHCRFVPVMVAEAMSRSETERLVARLNRLHIPVTDVLVNRLAPAESNCPACQDARFRQSRELAKCSPRLTNHAMWGIPLHGGEVRGRECLEAFWDGVGPVHGAANPAARTLLPTSPRVGRSVPPPGPDVRLLLFAGKGGVGKTTLACASALYLAAARQGRKALLFSTDPAHSLSDCLGIRIGPQQVPLAPGLWAMEVDAEAEFAELKGRYLREVEEFFENLLSQAGVDLEFDHEVVQRVLDLAPPGLDEVMALLRAMALFEADAYDLFVLDTAPTGHLIRLLETPELIDCWLKAVFGLFLKYRNVFRLPRIVDYLVGLSKQLKHLRGLLCDPARAQLVAVSIPTEMALAETTDLLAACQAAQVCVSAVFVNQVTLAEACVLCASVAAAEAVVCQHFEQALGGVPRGLVYRCGEPRGLARLAELGRALYEPVGPRGGGVLANSPEPGGVANQPAPLETIEGMVDVRSK